MTDITIDPFDQLRSELLRATTRDVSRTRRAHVMRIAVVSVAALLLLTGLAAAANNRVSTALQGAGGSVLDVFHGTSTAEPSADSMKLIQLMADMTNGVNPTERGAAAATDTKTKVLLHRKIDGVNVEITAFERTTPRGRTETCYSVSTDDQGAGQSATCTPAFNPGLPINFGMGIQSGPGAEGSVVTGITADNVELVELRNQHGLHAAAMGDHAFWWKAPSAEENPLMIRVTLTDGTTIERSTPLAEQRCNTPYAQTLKAWRVRKAWINRCIARQLATLKP